MDDKSRIFPVRTQIKYRGYVKQNAVEQRIIALPIFYKDTRELMS